MQTVTAGTEYVPALQFVHSADPDDDLNLPASQPTQEFLWAMPVSPRSHWQSVILPLPLGAVELLGHFTQTSDLAPSESQYLPTAQSVQFAVPLVGLNLPTTHAMQIPPSGPVYLKMTWEIRFNLAS